MAGRQRGLCSCVGLAGGVAVERGVPRFRRVPRPTVVTSHRRLVSASYLNFCTPWWCRRLWPLLGKSSDCAIVVRVRIPRF